MIIKHFSKLLKYFHDKFFIWYIDRKYVNKIFYVKNCSRIIDNLNTIVRENLRNSVIQQTVNKTKQRLKFQYIRKSLLKT